MNAEQLAEVMFVAYNDQGPNPWKTFDGRSVPPFAELGEQVRAKWIAAAVRVNWIAAEAQRAINANRDCPSCGGKGTVSMRPECAKCGEAWWGRDEAVRGDLARASALEQKVSAAEAAHAETTRRLGEANKRLDQFIITLNEVNNCYRDREPGKICLIEEPCDECVRKLCDLIELAEPTT